MIGRWIRLATTTLPRRLRIQILEVRAERQWRVAKLLNVQEQLLMDALTEWMSNTQGQMIEASGTDKTRKIWAVLAGVSGSETHASCLSSRFTTLGQLIQRLVSSKNAHRAAFTKVVQSERHANYLMSNGMLRDESRF